MRNPPPTPTPGPGYCCVYSHPPDPKTLYDAVAVSAQIRVPSPVAGETPGPWRLVLQIREGRKWADAGICVEPEAGVTAPSFFFGTHEKFQFVEVKDGRPVSGAAGKPGAAHDIAVELDERGAAKVTFDDRKPVTADAGIDKGLAGICLQLSPGMAARGVFARARFQRKGSSAWWPMNLSLPYTDPGLQLATAAGHAGKFLGRYQPK